MHHRHANSRVGYSLRALACIQILLISHYCKLLCMSGLVLNDSYYLRFGLYRATQRTGAHTRVEKPAQRRQAQVQMRAVQILMVPSGRPSLQESPWSAQRRPEGTCDRPRIGTAFSQRQFRLRQAMSAEPGALSSADTADATLVACWRDTFCRPHACAPRSCTCGWKRSRGPRPGDIREAERELAGG